MHPGCLPSVLDALDKKEPKVLSSVFQKHAPEDVREGHSGADQTARHFSSPRQELGRGDGALGGPQARRTGSFGEKGWAGRLNDVEEEGCQASSKPRLGRAGQV